MCAFKVEQIDHVHLYVSDQREGAGWLGRVLGLEVVEGYEDWAAGGGPLTVSSDGGNTSVAVFGLPPERLAARPRTTIAFRVGGEGFLDFLGRLEGLGLNGEGGRPLTAADVVDHDRSYSVYFRDPDGNPFELTTYDYEHVRGRLGRAGGGA